MTHARSLALAGSLALGGVLPLAAQRELPRRYDLTSYTIVEHNVLERSVVHYGKWVTASSAAALTILGAEEHQQSKREWDRLLQICHSSQAACDTGPDGRYLRSDAEQLYQLSRQYDRRANHLLLGAQGALLVTTALFIIDLHPGGPGNIPFPSMRVASNARGDGMQLGMRFAF
jgi:hypothetical protein